MRLLILLTLLAGPKLKSENQRIFDESTLLCERSKCKSCGKFSYYLNNIRYAPSYCEMMFRRDEETSLEDTIDTEIRRKYTK